MLRTNCWLIASKNMRTFILQPQAAEFCQQPRWARKWFSPRVFRKECNTLIQAQCNLCWTSDLQNCKLIIFIVLTYCLLVICYEGHEKLIQCYNEPMKHVFCLLLFLNWNINGMQYCVCLRCTIYVSLIHLYYLYVAICYYMSII